MAFTRGRSPGALLLAASLAAGAARAQEAFPLTDDPLLAVLVAEALEKNPELRAAEQAAAAARARIPQASALPDPMLGVGYQYGGRRLGSDDDTFVGFTLSQAFPFPGKRRLARSVEAKEAERAATPLARARLTLVARMRRGYTDLLLARENLALIDDQEEAGKGIEAVTRSRYAVGLSEQPDVLRAQAELARLDQMRIHEKGEETAAVAELNRLLARTAGSPIPTTPSLRSVAEVKPRVPSLEDVVRRIEEKSPELAGARLAVERSRAALDLARRNLKPDFVASTGYFNRGSIPAMWSVDLGLVLPLHQGAKQRQAIVEAEARLREAEATVEAVRLKARAMAERNLAEFDAALREAEAYSHGVLVVDGLAAEAALANYKTGKLPFVSVLEAYNTLYRDRWQHAELLGHVLWHSAALEEYAFND